MCFVTAETLGSDIDRNQRESVHPSKNHLIVKSSSSITNVSPFMCVSPLLNLLSWRIPKLDKLRFTTKPTIQSRKVSSWKRTTGKSDFLLWFLINAEALLGGGQPLQQGERAFGLFGFLFLKKKKLKRKMSKGESEESTKGLLQIQTWNTS